VKIYDITIPINPYMPVWPDDPGVEINRVSKIEEGANANVSHLSLSAHTGTHVDAPYHFIPEGASLDRVPLDSFIGEADVMEIPNVDLITAVDVHNANLPLDARRVLFKTRNSDIWARGENRFKEDFVALSPDAAQTLVDRDICLVGIDYLSVAPFKQSRPTHQILLAAGVVILEGINLTNIPPGRYFLYCLPLKLEGVDGAPARAILVGHLNENLVG
jgi:arylformamidase